MKNLPEDRRSAHTNANHNSSIASQDEPPQPEHSPPHFQHIASFSSSREGSFEGVPPVGDRRRSYGDALAQNEQDTDKSKKRSIFPSWMGGKKDSPDKTPTKVSRGDTTQSQNVSRAMSSSEGTHPDRGDELELVEVRVLCVLEPIICAAGLVCAEIISNFYVIPICCESFYELYADSVLRTGFKQVGQAFQALLKSHESHAFVLCVDHAFVEQVAKSWAFCFGRHPQNGVHKLFA